MSINVTVLSGNLTKDPVLRYTAAGTAVAGFTIAQNIKKDAPALFMNCTAWEKLAEVIVGSFTKGMPIVVTGRLEPREWTGKDGVKHIEKEITVYQIGSLPKKQGEAAGTGGPAEAADSVPNEDVPF